MSNITFKRVNELLKEVNLLIKNKLFLRKENKGLRLLLKNESKEESLSFGTNKSIYIYLLGFKKAIELK
jgi:hypothetical protein